MLLCLSKECLLRGLTFSCTQESSLAHDPSFMQAQASQCLWSTSAGAGSAQRLVEYVAWLMMLLFLQHVLCLRSAKASYFEAHVECIVWHTIQLSCMHYVPIGLPLDISRSSLGFCDSCVDVCRHADQGIVVSHRSCFKESFGHIRKLQ